jgi:hypothetical protein
MIQKRFYKKDKFNDYIYKHISTYTYKLQRLFKIVESLTTVLLGDFTSIYYMQVLKEISKFCMHRFLEVATVGHSMSYI